jgi:hypothetical protein
MYMLLQISESKDGLVSGTHVQWCCACTLEEAAKRARETEAANSNRIEVAVVEELYAPYCLGKQYQNLKRLDRRKNHVLHGNEPRAAGGAGERS